MKYNKRNIDNLNNLADNTKAAAFKWYQYCLDNGIEILVYETIRTIEQQRENVRKGASQTMRSYHLVGQALDFVPIKSNGTEDWNGYNKEPWASAIRYAKNIGFEWGGDWKGFVDSPHLQYNYKGYGTDTFGKGGTTQPPIQTKQNVIQSGAFSPYETPDVMGALTSLKMTATFILQSDGLTYFVSEPTSDAQLKGMKSYLDRRGWWYTEVQYSEEHNSTSKQNVIQSGAFSPYETPDVMGALTSLKMTAKFILQSDGLTYFVSDPTSDAQSNAMKEYLDRRGWWYEVK
ncbi:N-acetylmuramoyl-L-alanine amidase C-terminal domain-containing protein [Bacillus thuringiensis]|uniref:N-acetylmuramoyl-L-alanine amidase C-terminal domain-containing protein n=1 Tax=Bacillus thuringiensis TaxID=1428 RepID=UPI003C6D3A61